MELAVAGRASMLIANDLKDLRSRQLRFPEIRLLSPYQALEEL